MNLIQTTMNSVRLRTSALVLGALAVLAGCGGGGLDPILGSPGVTTPPTVTLTSPASTAPAVTGVATSARVQATFSKAMNAATINASTFTLACPAGTATAGAVTYDATTRIATLTPAAALPNGTTCVATVTTGAQDSTGIALASAYAWSFVTVPDTTPPTVIATVPTANAVGVLTTAPLTATFSEPMSAATITAANFTLACPAGTPVAAAVSYDAASRTATLTPAAALPAGTVCVATVSTGVRDSSGLAMAAAYVWSFTTVPSAAIDTTRPTVIFTVPTAGAAGVAANTAISATFSEAMNPATINAASFTLNNTTLGSAVAGSVSYVAASRTATFTPAAAAGLPAGSAFTATVTSAATDLAGNALAGNTAVLPGAGNHVWTFATGAAGGADVTPPTITAISPADGAAGACVTRNASATFSEAMNPASITTATFGVTDGGVAVPGSVSYDAPSQVATFTPANPAGFAGGRTFVVTVKSGAAGVKDLAGNALAADRVWTFSTGAQACLSAVNLGTAAGYGAFGGGAGVTNQGINTSVGGNLGTTAACTLITGFHSAANVYTETPLNVGAVNGSIFCGPPAPGTVASLAAATQARADAQAAYNSLAALPPGSDPGAGQLGGRVLTPGVYTAAGGTFAITGGDLTLNAQGDSGAVWVFQAASALTVGLPATPRRVILAGGAQAANVFWQVGSAARIEVGSTMVGTIIAPAGVTISTAGQTIQTTLIGRAIGLTASVTMVNTTIVAP